jgi:ubiquitin-conjugating enzyme E2 variant
MPFRFQKSPLRYNAAAASDRSNYAVGEPDAPSCAPGRPLQNPACGDAPGRIHRLLELAATILFPALFVSPLLLSYQQLSEAECEWLAFPGAVAGLIFGDFVTGLVHWAADTYGEESTPVIGRSLVKPFRTHHVRPQEICEHGIVETIGNTCILAAPLLALFIALAAYGETSAAVAFAVFAAVVTVGVTVATNQFHKWAHQQRPRRPVRLLQRARVILSPDHHRTHHTAPFESSYAITNGWLNPLLNRTGFFRRLEGALRSLGIRPSRETSSRAPEMRTPNSRG